VDALQTLLKFSTLNMSENQFDLSIAIPAFNEEERIGNTLEEIIRYFKYQSIYFEVIVVDDGSSDRTAEVAVKKLTAVPYQILKNPRNKGKGFSVRRGVLAARGEIILFTDADLSTPIEEFSKFQTAFQEGYDIAVGSRGSISSQVEVRQNLMREFMGKTFNVIAQILSFRGIHDSQCGFKAFTSKAGKALFQRQKLDGFCFDAEILFLAQKMGFQIKEIGVRWRNSPQSKVKVIRDSLSMLFDLFRIRLLHLGEKY